MATGRPIQMQALAIGELEEFVRPCVDCGLWTSLFCDHCLAIDRLPNERWCGGQHTPLCAKCDDERHACHFCYGKSWVMPLPWK